MSATDLYFTLPLAVLRSGAGVSDVMDAAISCGIVNAGIGYRKTHGEGLFSLLLEQAREHARRQRQPVDCPPHVPPDLWEAALAGAKVLGVQGGCRAVDATNYQKHQARGAVFLQLRADWMWNATYSARREAGKEVPAGFKQLSWREFRILAAILSAKVNSHGFVFIGWETLQARACGFHSKALYKAGADSLPPHCQPLSRRILRQELEKLETLGYFLRCRYSTGPRGGFMAYSFRHPKRADLVKAIQAWSAANHAFQTKAAANRAADLAAFRTSQRVPSESPVMTAASC
ncbi:hypothetical protein [Prosthecobacter sp.]|uniref:hypothetical protein n=1 Tax=Prosthecobacter sp. TaxID=1965333 RepID=UPI003784FA45